MPLATIWTPDRDSALLRLRAAGVSWDVVGRVLGVSRNTALERGLRKGARRERLAPPPVVAAPVPVDVSDARLPLPAGDPVSWGAITEGTVLAGSQYRPLMPGNAACAQ